MHSDLWDLPFSSWKHLHLPAVQTVAVGEEPPVVGEVEAEEEEAEVVALAYVTAWVSLAYEWSQENGLCSAASRAEDRTGLVSGRLPRRRRL